MKSAIIAVDKSFNYRIPNLAEDMYVRTGVIGDGSCFFHAYLRAFNFKYKYMPPSERTETVQKLRADLATAVSLETLRAISGGEYRRMLFFGALRQQLERRDIILSAATLVKILEVTTNFKDNFYTTFIEEALREETLAASPVAVKQQFIDAIKQVFVKANESSLDTFRRQLTQAEIGATEIEYISRYLKCNFLFLYETERGIERYPFTVIVNEEWPFCVLLWIERNHYEVIGKKEQKGSNSVINRIFYKDDEIIEKFLKEKQGSF